MQGERGFTLLELLVAVAVSVIVLTSVYGVYAGVSRARDRVERRSEATHQARVVFDRLGRELRGAYPAGGGAPPFAGGNTGRPFLLFATTASTPEGGTHGGVRVVRYELLPAEQPEQPGELRRSETPAFLGEPPPEQSYRMLAGVAGLQLRFYVDGNWSESWTGSNGKQPQAVEVTLTLQAENERLAFVSAFALPAIERAL